MPLSLEFKFFILCVMGKSARTIEVHRLKCLDYKCVKDQHFYCMGYRQSYSTRISIFSNIQHYAVYVSTMGRCMPSRSLRWLDAPLDMFTSYIRLKSNATVALEEEGPSK